MLFGLTNAPATFQAIMNDLFRPFLCKFVLVFFDDILIYSSTWVLHLEHLSVVLQCLQQNQFYAKLSKCSFGQSQVDYLGHIVSHSGVQMDPSKIEAVHAWPVPTTVTQLRAFLGLSGYYRRFIRNYASIASPITDLLQKDCFIWNYNAQTAFEALKSALLQAPVLPLLNFSKPFILETDAFNLGIGAILTQNGHPIAYFSKKLLGRMQQQSAYVQELYAIAEVVAKFRHYLLGHHFVIHTDQKSLRHLQDQKFRLLSKRIGYRNYWHTRTQLNTNQVLLLRLQMLCRVLFTWHYLFHPLRFWMILELLFLHLLHCKNF